METFVEYWVVISTGVEPVTFQNQILTSKKLYHGETPLSYKLRYVWYKQQWSAGGHLEALSF